MSYAACPYEEDIGYLDDYGLVDYGAAGTILALVGGTIQLIKGIRAKREMEEAAEAQRQMLEAQLLLEEEKTAQQKKLLLIAVPVLLIGIIAVVRRRRNQ